MTTEITVFLDGCGRVFGMCPIGIEPEWLRAYHRNGDHVAAVSQRRSTAEKWEAYLRHRAGFRRTPDEERANETEAQAILFA